MPIAFGCGIVVYFTADREPASWAAVVLLVAASVGRDPGAASGRWLFRWSLGLAAAAAGFATATLKRAIIAHPVLSAPVWNVEIAGFVEVREERERSDRIVVRVDAHRGPAAQRAARARAGVGAQGHRAGGRQLRRVQGAARRRRSSRCGPAATTSRATCISSGIGASGFVLGRIQHRASRRDAPTLRLRYATAIDGMREAIDKRIRAVVPGDKGAIASALITGKRDAISAPVNEAMYVSSLAHVLSISGYHMAVVAGDRVLRLARVAGADAGLRQPLSDQEMGGGRGAGGGRVLSVCCRARRSRPSASSS